MSLLDIRNRIKSIKTIYKTTFSMRTLAMSLHGQFKNKLEIQAETMLFLNNIKNKYIESEEDTTNCIHANEILYIFIGSDKGLCGAYNQHIILLAKKMIKHHDEKVNYIILGKKLESLLLLTRKLLFFSPLNKKNIYKLVDSILDRIKANNIKKIVLLGTKSKNIFLATPFTTSLYLRDHSLLKKDFYSGDQDKEIIKEYFLEKYYKKTIETIILESFVSEQASRFIAMENAYKNAEAALKETLKVYNKKRQGLITQELQTIISSSFIR